MGASLTRSAGAQNRTSRLLNQALHILLEATPAHISLPELEKAMLQVESVAKVHDLHVWTITSGVDAMSAHVLLEPGASPTAAGTILQEVAELLGKQFGIAHSTIQVESATHMEGERLV